jgi:D-glycero-alpha-D-manno-heptose 1-phosphate guanylyltransferase
VTIGAPEAIVLAGGEGTRLREALPGIPKVLAPIGGQPFLLRLLDWLEDQGMTAVVLATGYAAEDVESVASGWRGSMRISFSREREPLGTGGAIALAFEKVDGDRAWVFNGDSFCDALLSEISSAAAAVPEDAWLVAVEVENAARFGTLVLEGDRVVRFEEKRGRNAAGLINAGIYVLPRALVTRGAHSIERDVFPALAAEGRLHAVTVPARFIDIGTPESLLAAHSFFA